MKVRAGQKMLTVKQLCKTFQKKEALIDVAFSFEKGICGILGPNGAGKTTLFRCITGITQAESGEIEKPGTIGYLPQRFGAYKTLTVQEILEYYASLKRIPQSKQKAAIEEAAVSVNLTDYFKSRVSTLSGGVVRRLGIAQAILGNPVMILFDEPTAGLDPEERIRFKGLLLDLQHKQIPVMISTHIVEDVEAVCSRVLIMNKGRIVKDGTLSDITNVAKGKVYQIPASERVNIQKPFVLLRSEFKDERESVRIISTAVQSGVPLPPTLEDGYICCIHGMI